MTISAKQFGIGLLLIIAFSLSAWSILLSNAFHSVANPENPHEADAIMQDVVATVFNEAGHPSLAVVTPKMVHFPQDDSTQLTTPRVTVYRSSAEPWTILADSAKTLHGLEQIQFTHHVNILHHADAENPNTSVQTELLTIYPSQNIATTDQAILFIQPETVIHAVGMLANLDEGTIKLLSQAKGEYVPES